MPEVMMPAIVNIAAYKFATLRDLKSLRERLASLCKSWKLKGTILLSEEGINLFVAGQKNEIDLLLAELRAIPELQGLDAKFSESHDQPFHRMLVKIKREIIAFGIEGIDPARNPSPKLTPRKLKQWLDEGRPITLLDTRNEYEVQLGSFRNAVTLKIDHFRKFPDAVRQLPPTLKQQPIVMFCTGGIRCEKAGPFMQREGFENIYQLEGGILKYFEECGGEHYQGECFVFDHRVGLDPSLQESETAQCFNCQSPLSTEDQADPRFVEGISCPYCYVASEDQTALTLKCRHESLKTIIDPLPGSQPYENRRPLNVPAEFAGQSVLDFLCNILGQIPRDTWKQVCDSGRMLKRIGPRRANQLSSEATIAVTADAVVQAGDRFLHIVPIEREPDVNPRIRILHEDEAILVVHKPAPLPMHPCGRFNRNTLGYILNKLYEPQSPRPIHRLDANTEGLVLFARTRHFARYLQKQFEPSIEGGIEKRYLARVQGHPVWDRFSCDLPISSEPGQAGSREIDVAHGQPALTEFQVLHRYPDGTTLLEAIPRTGRTNQIRIHLWSMKLPICGDLTYLSDGTIGETQTLTLDSPPLCLLAQQISFNHPLTNQRMVFQAELPDWCKKQQ